MCEEIGQKRLFSLREASVILGVSSRHLQNLIRRGEIRAIRLGRRVLLPLAEINRLCGCGLDVNDDDEVQIFDQRS